jgi:hypothetical protein
MQAVTLFTFIGLVPISNLGLDTKYLEMLSMFSLVAIGNCYKSISNLSKGTSLQTLS